MKLSPLQPRQLFFTRVDLSAQTNASAADIGAVNIELDVECVENIDLAADNWFVMLRVRITPIEGGVKPPYVGMVEACASFDVNPTVWPKDQTRKLVYINGGGIIYAAVREMISNITARGIYGGLTLPSWSFLDMFNEDEAKRKQPTLPFEEKSNPSSLPAQP